MHKAQHTDFLRHDSAFCVLSSPVISSRVFELGKSVECQELLRSIQLQSSSLTTFGFAGDYKGPVCYVKTNQLFPQHRRLHITLRFRGFFCWFFVSVQKKTRRRLTKPGVVDFSDSRQSLHFHSAHHKATVPEAPPCSAPLEIRAGSIFSDLAPCLHQST